MKVFRFAGWFMFGLLCTVIGLFCELVAQGLLVAGHALISAADGLVIYAISIEAKEQSK